MLQSVSAAEPKAPHFEPDPASTEASQLAAFMRYCSRELGRTFGDYRAFFEFSVSDYRTFWLLFVAWSQFPADGAIEPACVGDLCEKAVFFPGLRLNYAEVVLRGGDGADRPAVTARHADGKTERLTFGALRTRVARLARHLEKSGVGEGDRVAMIARNNADAVIAALATASIGATLSSCSPEMGAFAILSRFAPLQPTILMSVFSTQTWDTGGPVAARVEEVVRQLPSLQAIVALDDGPVPDGLAPDVAWLADLTADGPDDEAQSFPRLPFNHPLFIMFSSGTTGAPKCIIHGVGGTLIEHLKEHRLHCDLRQGDKLFFQTSCAWMMWNWQLTALAAGAEIVLFDGPLEGPETLWRIVDEEDVTVFGTSPAYLQWCERAGFAPAATLALPALRSILSTGSVLPARQFDWVWANVKELPLQSISGGTDIIGCFVLGNPMLPVHRGEAQCRSLAMDVRALASSDTGPAVGELICANPFPSRPLGFFGDESGERFHAAYFEQNPGVWTHGDLIEFTPSGGAILHGRSDGILNVNGIRVGPAEIYRILEDIDEVVEATAVEQSVEAGSRMILLVVLRAGLVLDDALTAKIRTTLAQRGSPALVPSRIAQVGELPITHSGKRSEAAARDAVNGRAARNRDALRNPESLDAIVRLAQMQPAPKGRMRREAASQSELESDLQQLCAEALGLSSIKATDNFFALGADSLSIVNMQMAIEQQLGRRLRFSALFRAPTVRGLCELILRTSVAPGADAGSAAPAEEEADNLTVRPAAPADIDAICRLLDDGFGSSIVTVADWRKLFAYDWLPAKPNLGFVALDRGTIVGFVGAIYADRTIGGRTVRVCNLTSWYVRPQYRGLGGYLLASALGDDTITYTALTPILLTRHALAKLGFEPIVASKRVFPPLLHLGSMRADAPRITFDPTEIRTILRGEDLRIFEDHRRASCVQAAIVDGADVCYIVSKRRIRRGRLHRRLPIAISIPYSELLYCSQPQVLVRHLERIKLALLWREKTLALMVDENMLSAERPRGLAFESRTMFRSRHVKGHELDKLYSELVLLPI